MSRGPLLILTIVVVAACAGTTPAAGVGSVPCELVPLAREVPTHVRDGLAAARAGDGVGAARAAERLRMISSRILSATSSAPDESPSDYLVAFWTAAYTADQVAFLLSDIGSGGVPDAEELASLGSMEATIGDALDRSLQAIENQATTCI